MCAVSQREWLGLERVRDRMEFEKMQRFGASADETVVESNPVIAAGCGSDEAVVESNSDCRRLRI